MTFPIDRRPALSSASAAAQWAGRARKSDLAMKSELNINFCHIIPRNSNDDIGWFFINVEHSLPDDTGSRASVKLEIPVRLHTEEALPLNEPEVMQKARDLMLSAIAAIESASP
jgi:hypothetical protein